MTQLVTVIIPCYNGGRYLEEAVESVLAQTYDNIECLIVDDGSTDNTCQLSESLMKRDSRVRYFYKKHSGLGATRNFGIKRSNGDWIQHLDADDWLHKKKIQFQLQYVKGENKEENVVLYSDYEVIMENQPENVRFNKNIIGQLSNDQLLDKILNWSFKPNIPLHVNNTLFKKSVYNLKLFREDFRAFQDLELFVDLLLKDVKFIYTPIVGMYYRVHKSNLFRDVNRIQSAYIKYLEALFEKDPALVQRCPNMGILIRNAISKRDKNRFNMLVELIEKANTPVYFSKKRIAISNGIMLKFAYFLGSRFPQIAKGFQ